MSRPASGFSLMELVVAMAIVAILTTIAIPSYQSYQRKSKRSVAQRFLLDIANREERYYLDNRSYTLDLSLLGYGAASIYLDTEGREVAATANERLYKVTVTAPAGGIATGYTLTADAQRSQVKDSSCASLTLNAASLKTPAACW